VRARWIPLLFALVPATLRPAGISGADVLNTRPSARASALGGAFVALGDDLSGLSYNPAALASITGPSLDFLHFAAIDSVSLEDISYAQPFDFGTPGAAVVYRGQPAISNPLATDAPVVASDLVITAAYSAKMSLLELPLPGILQQANAGLAVKFVDSQLGQYTAYTGALDLGLRTDVGDGIMLGGSLLNIGPAIKFISVADPLPATALLGLSRAFDPIWGNQINASADMEVPFFDTTEMRFGIEDWIFKSLALRVGYVLDSAQSLNGLTAGFGVLLDQDGLLFHLDYAMLPYYYSGFSDFEAQQQFQMSLTF
jgi:hypothetical protein